MQLETVRIKSPVSEENQNGYIVINKTDFDSKEHEEFVEAEEIAPADMSVPQLKNALGKLGIEIPEGAKKADLLELLTNPKE